MTDNLRDSGYGWSYRSGDAVEETFPEIGAWQEQGDCADSLVGLGRFTTSQLHSAHFATYTHSPQEPSAPYDSFSHPATRHNPGQLFHTSSSSSLSFSHDLLLSWQNQQYLLEQQTPETQSVEAVPSLQQHQGGIQMQPTSADALQHLDIGYSKDYVQSTFSSDAQRVQEEQNPQQQPSATFLSRPSLANQSLSFPPYSGYSTTHPQATHAVGVLQNQNAIYAATGQPPPSTDASTVSSHHHQQVQHQYNHHQTQAFDYPHWSASGSVEAGSPSFAPCPSGGLTGSVATPVGSATPDVPQSVSHPVFAKPHVPSPSAQQANTWTQTTYSPPFEQSWSSGTGSSACSPTVPLTGRMELPTDYFQSMPGQSYAPYPVPLSQPSFTTTQEYGPSFSSSLPAPLLFPPVPTSAASEPRNLPKLGEDGHSASQQTGVASCEPASDKAKTGKREHRKHEASCDRCLTLLGTVFLRGYPQDFRNPFGFNYLCVVCSSTGFSSGDGQAWSEPASTQMSSSLSSSGGRKKDQMCRKRLRTNDPYGAMICDVCMKTIAQGGPVPMDGKADLTFSTEMVCCRCDERYARCSDCGGGGGARLGVGKWRCKELFTYGRKTCNLNHARQSSVSTMQYYVTRCADIPAEEIPEISKQCKRVFESALYSSLAVPEVLEPGTANASTFQDIVTRVESGWAEARYNIEQDIEAETGYRRYLGLRWAAPKPRKPSAKKSGKAANDQPSISAANSTGVLRPGMLLSGYVSGEWDIRNGTFYVSVSVPYSTGEQYEGSAHLIAIMTKRILEDREAMILELTACGRQQEALHIPPVQHTFTMLFFTPESKLVTYLETKRQLIPLDRYLANYPDTSPHIFPPYRRVAPHIEQQPGWNCLVRRTVAVSALSAQPQPSMKRSARNRQSVDDR